MRDELFVSKKQNNDKKKEEHKNAEGDRKK